MWFSNCLGGRKIIIKMPISQKGRWRSSKGEAAAQYHMSAATDNWRAGTGTSSSMPSLVLSWGSCLSWHQPKDREAWHATVHGIAKSQTRFSDLTTTIFISALLITDSVIVDRLSILYSWDSQWQYYCHFQPSNTLLFILRAVGGGVSCALKDA